MDRFPLHVDRTFPAIYDTRQPIRSIAYLRLGLPRVFARAALIALAPATAAAQAPAPQQASYPSIRVGGRLHVQAYWLDNEAYGPVLGPASSFFIRRARIEAVGALTEFVSFVIQPSFENAAGREPNLRLRDAYIDVRLTPATAGTSIALRVGQEKRPFNRLELLSSHNLPPIERGAGRGMVPISSNRLFEESGFLAHDLGASVKIAVGQSPTFQAGVYNGQGESFTDVNDSKSFGARGTVSLTSKLNVGASVFSHEGIAVIAPVPPATGEAVDSAFRNTGYAVDGAWGKPGEPGPLAVVDYGWGKRFSGRAESIRGLSVVTAYHRPVRSGPAGVVALEPALRFDYADPDRGTQDDEVRLFSGVLGVYLAGRAHVRLAYERQAFADRLRTPIAGFRSAITIGF